MKVYFHLAMEEFTNCYVVVNDDPDVMEAIIIDPGKLSTDIINQIENGGYKLKGVFITHNHKSHIRGLNTLLKIYTPTIYAADYAIAGENAIILRGDGEITVAGLTVQYTSVPGHTSDSMVYRIGNLLFTGDSIFAGTIGETTSSYSNRLLKNNLNMKILSQSDDCILLPGHGPPTTVAAEKKYNIDLNSQSL